MRMRTAWAYEATVMDDRGRPIKTIEYSFEPVENGKKIKVGYVTTKVKDTK
jgi:hypothetical protein